MKRRLVITLIIFFFIQSSYAQSSLTLPEQNANEAKEKYVLLSDFYNSENYMGAYESLLWIMDHAPDMHESVYVIGIKSVKKNN